MESAAKVSIDLSQKTLTFEDPPVFLCDMLSDLNQIIFKIRGQKPWTRGYVEYRQSALARALADPIDMAVLPPGFGFRLDERIIEYTWTLNELSSGFEYLLDAGSVLNQRWLLELPTLRNKKIFISTLAPESLAHTDLGVSYIYEDLRRCSFRDQVFDTIVSISTIEHIGMDNAKHYTKNSHDKEKKSWDFLKAIAELKRVLKPGGRLLLTVPFGKYHDYGWFQVFDSLRVDKLIETFAPEKMREDHFRYSAHGWVNSTRQDSKDQTYFDVHSATGFDPDFAAASRAVACLSLTKQG